MELDRQTPRSEIELDADGERERAWHGELSTRRARGLQRCRADTGHHRLFADQARRSPRPWAEHAAVDRVRRREGLKHQGWLALATTVRLDEQGRAPPAWLPGPRPGTARACSAGRDVPDKALVDKEPPEGDIVGRGRQRSVLNAAYDNAVADLKAEVQGLIKKHVPVNKRASSRA